jgi:hypothetical protein
LAFATFNVLAKLAFFFGFGEEFVLGALLPPDVDAFP